MVCTVLNYFIGFYKVGEIKGVIWPPGTAGGGFLMEVCLPDFSDQNGAKIIPFGVLHTYMA